MIVDCTKDSRVTKQFTLAVMDARFRESSTAYANQYGFIKGYSQLRSSSFRASLNAQVPPGFCFGSRAAAKALAPSVPMLFPSAPARVGSHLVSISGPLLEGRDKGRGQQTKTIVEWVLTREVQCIEGPVERPGTVRVLPRL